MVDNSRKHTIHQKDMLINRDRLSKVLERKKMTYADLYYQVTDKYGIDIKYKSFMHILYNKASWKLLYAWAIIDVLNVGMLEVFDIVDIDREKALQEKENWVKKYQH